MLDRALEFSRAGDGRQAIGLFESMSTQSPDHALAHDLMGAGVAHPSRSRQRTEAA